MKFYCPSCSHPNVAINGSRPKFCGSCGSPMDAVTHTHARPTEAPVGRQAPVIPSQGVQGMSPEEILRLADAIRLINGQGTGGRQPPGRNSARREYEAMPTEDEVYDIDEIKAAASKIEVEFESRTVTFGEIAGTKKGKDKKIINRREPPRRGKPLSLTDLNNQIRRETDSMRGEKE